MTLAEALSEAQKMSSDSGIALHDFLYLLQDVSGFSIPEIRLQKDRLLSPAESVLWNTYSSRRLRGEPSQYITGKAYFYGREFHVSTGCLIPRPETEGLVDLALQYLNSVKPGSSVLDIGTGSGVIAITLKLELPDCIVHATDISEDALQIATTNALAHKAVISFRKADLWPIDNSKYDLIISNPPYIAENEYAFLDANVRDHEPKLALVASDRGLEYYKRIIPQLSSKLNEGGCAIFEIGEEQAAEIQKIASENGINDPEVLQDLAGRDRYFKISI